MINFTKMHGTGNDYIYIIDLDIKVKNPKKLAVEMSNRHYGIGSDGLILILPSKHADFKMRMFNADGSEAEMCGNGIRCFAKFVYDRKLIKGDNVRIETLAGIMEIKIYIKNKNAFAAKVKMGEPILQRDRIPMTGEPGMVIDEILPLDDGARFIITSLSMGNPHVIIFVEDLHNFPVQKYGPMIEHHDLFPQRTNVEFVQVIDRKKVIQRTWERGSGETLSCGTGASAVTVACVLTNKTDRKITIQLRGGTLDLEWNEKDNNVYLKGPAVEVFTGIWPN